MTIRLGKKYLNRIEEKHVKLESWCGATTFSPMTISIMTLETRAEVFASEKHSRLVNKVVNCSILSWHYNIQPYYNQPNDNRPNNNQHNDT